MGAEKPTISDIQPERKPHKGPKLSRKKAYSPPEQGRRTPSSA